MLVRVARCPSLRCQDRTYTFASRKAVSKKVHPRTINGRFLLLLLLQKLASGCGAVVIGHQTNSCVTGCFFMHPTLRRRYYSSWLKG